ncbi:MAG TPA: hypothetical protein VJ973_02155, partial [Christiangramia sp.]|nr:hypothetical protein [Christiangramia sp.]
MKINNIQILFSALCISVVTVGCSEDDDFQMAETPTMNPPVEMMEVDFSGTFSQVDHMGRPGINTVLSSSAEIKNMHNTTIPSEMG